MRGLRGKGGARQRTPRIRLALLGWIAAGVALSVGVSLALATNVLNVLGPPEASAPTLETGAPTLEADAPTLQIDQDHQDAGYGAMHSGRELSRAQAITLAQRRYHAQALRAHRVQSPGGHALYDIRLLSASGMVWTVRLDAQSGHEVP